MRGNVGNTGYWADGDIQDHLVVDLETVVVLIVVVDVVVVVVVGLDEEEDGGPCVVFGISFEQCDLACATLSPISFIVSEPKQFSKN